VTVALEILRLGSEGEAVRRWQRYLAGQGFLTSAADAIFGPLTEQGTKAFQRRAALGMDGVVGPMTYAAALQRGFDPGFTDPHGGEDGAEFPPRPDFPPLVSNAERARVFGEFDFVPVGADTDDVRILGGWIQANIRTVPVSQLAGVRGASASGSLSAHRLAIDAIRALFSAWESMGLEDLILTWEGCFAPRFVRGDRSVLSNHAWGTAFDINFEWNRMGTVPALRGDKGSVRELVPIANEHGFYWGGHFSRRDGMHFELAQLP
jgi:peptidoglycan hydrolase-like protein with peptidoglycan-binding domain